MLGLGVNKKTAAAAAMCMVLTVASDAVRAEDPAALQRQIEAQQRTMQQQQSNIHQLQSELQGVRGELEQLRAMLGSRQGPAPAPNGAPMQGRQGPAPASAGGIDYSAPVFDGSAYQQPPQQMQQQGRMPPPPQPYPPQGAYPQPYPQQGAYPPPQGGAPYQGQPNQGMPPSPPQQQGVKNAPPQYPVTPLGNAAYMEHQQQRSQAQQQPQPQPQQMQAQSAQRPPQPQMQQQMPPQPQPQPQQMQGPALQPVTPQAKQAYDAAYAFILQNDLKNAESAFRQYVASFPDNALTPNAWYWCGQSQYQMRNFNDARVSFLNVVRFTESGKRPDALFKLGMVHLNTGNKDKAAGYFRLVLSQYPNDAAAVLASKQMQENGLK